MPERLRAAVERIYRAEEVVERQRNRVEELKAAGKAARVSEELLEIYVSTLEIFEDHERALRAEVEMHNRVVGNGPFPQRRIAQISN